MKIVYLLVFIVIVNPLYSQYAKFAKILSKDGFVNIREQATGQSEVIDQLYTNDIFPCSDGDWCSVEIIRNNKKISGYVHKSNLIFLDSYEEVPVKKIQENKITFQNSIVVVDITQKSFNEAEHIIKYDTSDYRMSIESIDNMKAYRISNIPTMEYESVSITVNGQKISIPKTELANVFNPDLSNAKVFYDAKEKAIYITSESDIAYYEFYAVVWVVKNGKYERRAIDAPYSYK